MMGIKPINLCVKPLMAPANIKMSLRSSVCIHVGCSLGHASLESSASGRSFPQQSLSTTLFNVEARVQPATSLLVQSPLRLLAQDRVHTHVGQSLLGSALEPDCSGRERRCGEPFSCWVSWILP